MMISFILVRYRLAWGIKEVRDGVSESEMGYLARLYFTIRKYFHLFAVNDDIWVPPRKISKII
jgi:hypothetical protein